MNSPWGIEYSILKELNWTRDYLLWKISWVNVRLMLADAPSYRTDSDGDKKGKELEELDDFTDFLKL